MDGETGYKQRIADLYTRAADDYGEIGPHLFQHVGRRLVEAAGVSPGSRVLDVATGRGAVLFPAAERVGPTGYVLGVDLAEGMVRETTAAIDRAGLTNAEARLADAERLDLAPGSFDAALCSFAIFCFPRPRLALGQLRRALRQGGVVGVAVASQSDPRWAWQNELFGRYASVEEPPPGVLRGAALRRPGSLTSLLADAGFVDARELREQVDVTWRSPDEWWDALWTHGTRRAVESMTPAALAEFRSAVAAELRRLQAGPGLTERVELTFALARRP
jgi:ubiquinone/menaquinone biosynthesis C-methylase UbiE